MGKIAIFLGGGASAAEGAPVQSLLFKKYFTALRNTSNYSNTLLVNELRAYFKQMFFVDVLQDDLDSIHFPTFEEAIGLLDLAVRKRQSFRGFDLENLAPGSNRIGYLRQYLVLLMAEVLEDKTAVVRGLHRELVERLAALGYLADTIFMSTNYDLLIDRALAGRADTVVDYGISFTTNRRERQAAAQREECVRLYKVHGSLNWFYCPTCNSMELMDDSQSIFTLITDVSRTRCAACQSVRTPVIVPPTFYKDMSNSFLHIIWTKTERSLKEVEQLIFCGYSFPDADMHIKYLIKRMQTNRTDKLKITVINNYPGKRTEKMAEEQARYLRFLGTDIWFTTNSFEDFCRQTERFIRN